MKTYYNLSQILLCWYNAVCSSRDLLAKQHEHKKALSALMDEDILFEDTQLGQLSAKLQALIALRSAAKDRRLSARMRLDSSASEDDHRPVRRQVVTVPPKSAEKKVENPPEIKVEQASAARVPRVPRPVVSGVLTRTGQSGFSHVPTPRGGPKANNNPTPGPADDSVFM